MANAVIPKNSAGVSKAPLTGDLQTGELATDTLNGILYLKKSDGSIVELGGGSGYSLPVATATILGGVKQGASVTIDAQGVITVNDDGHNHVIGNIDGLQTALDSKSDDAHTHAGVYEPVFSKLTAFNKNFGTLVGTVAQGNDSRINNGQTAFGWGDHSLAGYLTGETSHSDVLVDGDFATNGFMKRTGAGTYGIVTDNSANWNTAFGWGDHSTAGYQSAATAVTTTEVNLSTWTIVETAGVLYFKVSGVSKAKLDASGNLTCVGDVQGYGTI